MSRESIEKLSLNEILSVDFSDTSVCLRLHAGRMINLFATTHNGEQAREDGQ